MPLLRPAGGCARIGLVCAALLAGCTSPGKESRATSLALAPMQHSRLDVARVRAEVSEGQVRNLPQEARPRPVDTAGMKSADIVNVSHSEMTVGPAPPAETTDDDALFAGQIELSLPELMVEVERRNPSLAAALAAWGAAGEKAPQAIALDDPTLTSMFAPASFASPTIQSSYIVGVGQKFPWAGKRELRTHVALWNAVAASLDYDEVRLRLAEAARIAFYDYYSVFRQVEVNDAALAAVRSFRETAKSKFEANQVTEQDLLQADVELAQLEQRRVELDQFRQVATARINRLLHREPQLALPIPPQRLDVSGELPDVDALRAQALESRPDLSALMARVQAAQNDVALMCKEFYPDFEVMGRYDTFWTDPAQRAQVALNFNIPLNQDRRQAAVREAIFRLNKLHAEYNQQVDTVRTEVQTAFARLSASRRTLELFTGRLLPASESNVAAATSGYEAGTIDFLRLVQAQRELIDLNEKYQMAIVEYYRNSAELDRVVGAGLPAR